MLGLLLARAGVDVLVLEKHKDFLRDFRGDTIHPSTLEIIHHLGWLEEFLRRPHQEVRQIQAHFAERVVTIADFSHLPTHCKFIAFMPQWDFLDFLASHARSYPGFRLRMETEVTDLLWEKGGQRSQELQRFEGGCEDGRDGRDPRVVGVTARSPQGELRVLAPLVVGADGRSSIVRERAGLEVVDFGVPIDVLWFRLSRHPAKDPPQSFGYIGVGQFMVLLDRGDYWQCAYVIRKRMAEEKRKHGLPAFQEEVVRCTPFLEDRVDQLKDWDQIKLLSVKVDRLRNWAREGLLCIGDAAHAMSPVAGVGINLAIQDAVAAARILGQKLRTNQLLTTTDLGAVQARRERPTRLTQGVQIFIHEHILERIFEAAEPIAPPWEARLLDAFPLLRRIPARMVGLGFRPEWIEK